MTTTTPYGLYCPAGGFYLDPARAVGRAVITHAHADHARPGSKRYLAAASGLRVLRRRLGARAVIDTLEYGQSVNVGGVKVSLHPAGHILGSAQVRLEHRGEVWVVSGDYKLDADPTCAPFEPIRCHAFVTEATFALPVYRWPPADAVFDEINAWWRANRDAGHVSVLLGYALGKAQRLLAGVDPSIGPILSHAQVEGYSRDYRAGGVKLPKTRLLPAARSTPGPRGALVIAPPAAIGTRRAGWFPYARVARVSGWMLTAPRREQTAIHRGFVLSDHADWPGLLSAIEATGASRVWITHGYTSALLHVLRKKGLEVRAISGTENGDRVAAVRAGKPGARGRRDANGQLMLGFGGGP